MPSVCPFLAIRLRTRKQYKTLPYARLCVSVYRAFSPQNRAFFLQSAQSLRHPQLWAKIAHNWFRMARDWFELTRRVRAQTMSYHMQYTKFIQ